MYQPGDILWCESRFGRMFMRKHLDDANFGMHHGEVNQRINDIKNHYIRQCPNHLRPFIWVDPPVEVIRFVEKNLPCFHRYGEGITYHEYKYQDYSVDHYEENLRGFYHRIKIEGDRVVEDNVTPDIEVTQYTLYGVRITQVLEHKEVHQFLVHFYNPNKITEAEIKKQLNYFANRTGVGVTETYVGTKSLLRKQKNARAMLNFEIISFIFIAIGIIATTVGLFIPPIFWYTIIPFAVAALFDLIYMFAYPSLRKISNFYPSFLSSLLRILISGGFFTLAYYVTVFENWRQILILLSMIVVVGLFVGFIVEKIREIRRDYDYRARVKEDIRNITIRKDYYTYDTSGDKVQIEALKKKLEP